MITVLNINENLINYGTEFRGSNPGMTFYFNFCLIFLQYDEFKWNLKGNKNHHHKI